jgi:tetratricopeptide (TPR) repeat protein
MFNPTLFRFFCWPGACCLLLSLAACKQGEDRFTQRDPTMCAPKLTDADWYTSDNQAPLFEGLGDWRFPVTTENELAQRYFDQGLALAYAFNHAEAARSFYYAAKLDPQCAMAHWGFAYVLGPNYNAGMEPDHYERAYAAAQRALKLAPKASPKEQALIRAMAQRYVEKPVDDRSTLDQAYAQAMKQAYEQFPEDGDVATLYAEALMDLHPWDLWEADGQPKPWTPEIVAVLEQIIAAHPRHPGAHHLYIHAVEASRNPHRGLPSAKLFDEGLVPGAGHLVHMPSHIYIRTGDYHLGTLANINAAKIDSLYVTACHAQGAYPLAYYPHVYHFMAGTATLEGNSHWALYAARKVAEHADPQVMREPGWGTIQHYYTIPYYVYVKFGKWDDILAMPPEAADLKYPQAVRHYARGMAFLGKKDLAQAKLELSALKKMASDERLQEITIWDINAVHTLLQIAQRVLEAEILASERDFASSIRLLQEAIVIEDGLHYNEPPDWFFSVRHHLGAVQIEAGQYQDAIRTFETDLELLPKNGWALHGLKLAYDKLGAPAGAIQTQLTTAWATADVSLVNARIK